MTETELDVLTNYLSGAVGAYVQLFASSIFVVLEFVAFLSVVALLTFILSIPFRYFTRGL